MSLEAPGEVLEPGDEAEWAELASGRRVKVLSIEDLLLWRLREWLHWHHASGFHQAAHLLLSEELDRERLERRAEEEGLARTLQALRALTTAIGTPESFVGPVGSDDAVAQERRELVEFARRLRTPS